MEYICENFKSSPEIDSLYIGYSKHSTSLFIVVPAIASFLNIFAVITYFKTKVESERKQ